MSRTRGKQSLHGALVLLATALLCTQAAAADSAAELSPWRFAGYGTLSRSWDDSHRLAPIRDFSQRPADSFSTGPSWRLDSRLGLQLSYRFSPQAEAVVQVVGRDQADSRLQRSIEQAYLDFQHGSDTRVRLGRVGYDAFLMSDHRNLGYAYAWVRPPREFYGWLPMFSVDGADLTHEFRQGETNWRLRAQFGSSAFGIPIGEALFDFKADRLWSLSLQREAGPWRIKAGLSGFRIAREAEPLTPLHAGLDAIATAGIPGISQEAYALSRESRFQGARVTYLTLGAAYDDGTWLAQAELSQTRTSADIATSGHTGYLAFGRRFGAFTPYAMLSASRPTQGIHRAINNWGGLNAVRDQAYFVVNSTRQDQESLALGVRLDVHAQAALKLQWERTHIHPEGYVLWNRSVETNPLRSTVSLLTMSLDFVF